MLSHDNIISNIQSVVPLMPIGAGAKVLSFLPLNHIFERVCAYNYLYIGANVVFVGIDNLGGEGGDLKAVQPTFFTTVPRLLEKVYEKLYNKGLELTGIKKKLFFWALKLTNDYEYDKTYSGWRGFQHKIADKLIYSKWREALGGNLVGILVGASACPVKIARTFSAAGIPVREGYGMTETSPGISISGYAPKMALLGTVGPVIQGVEVRIDSSDGNYREGEGEILATGRNVMLGYYNKPVQTAEVIKMIDGKRWMCTGDVGRFVEKDGKPFLKITDRKKELFKTSGGKYVAPAPIENSLKEHFLVEQVMVLGENQKFVSALIVPAVEALKDWCGSHDVTWKNAADAIKNPAVIAAFQKAVDQYNPNFSKVEQIKKFVLIADSWEPVKADGSEAELTPTMKLKRRVILDKYKAAIQNIYA
jgi:long-chain acyl-CoA synthetase